MSPDIDARIGRLEARMTRIEETVAAINTTVARLDTRVSNNESRLDRMSELHERMAAVQVNLAHVETAVAGIDRKLDTKVEAFHDDVERIYLAIEARERERREDGATSRRWMVGLAVMLFVSFVASTTTILVAVFN